MCVRVLLKAAGPLACPVFDRTLPANLFPVFLNLFKTADVINDPGRDKNAPHCCVIDGAVSSKFPTKLLRVVNLQTRLLFQLFSPHKVALHMTPRCLRGRWRLRTYARAENIFKPRDTYWVITELGEQEYRVALREYFNIT
jgi:hypothetical protein